MLATKLDFSVALSHCIHVWFMNACIQYFFLIHVYSWQGTTTLSAFQVAANVIGIQALEVIINS